MDDEFNRDLKEAIYGPNEPIDYEDFPEDDGAVAEYEARKRQFERDERMNLPVVLGSVCSDLRTVAESLIEDGDDDNRKEILEILERLEKIASAMEQRIRSEEASIPSITARPANSGNSYDDIPF